MNDTPETNPFDQQPSADATGASQPAGQSPQQPFQQNAPYGNATGQPYGQSYESPYSNQTYQSAYQSGQSPYQAQSAQGDPHQQYQQYAQQPQQPYAYDQPHTGQANAQAPYANPYYPPQGAPYPPAYNDRWNVMCIVGFVLAFIIPVVGLVLSIVALTQINKSGEKSRAMAIAGIAIGAVLTVIGILCIVFLTSLAGYVLDNADLDLQCVGDDCTLDYGYGHGYYDDGEICFDDGTCIDPYDFDFDNGHGYDFDFDDLDGLMDDSHLTAFADAPATVELVD